MTYSPGVNLRYLLPQATLCCCVVVLFCCVVVCMSSSVVLLSWGLSRICGSSPKTCFFREFGGDYQAPGVLYVDLTG